MDFSPSLDKKKFFYLLLAILFFIIDQVLKRLIASRFLLNEIVPVISNFLNFVYIHNRGLVFGVLAEPDDKLPFTAVLIFSLATIIFIIAYFIITKNQSTVVLFGFALVIGGAFGNIFDRLTAGYVIDFVDFYIGAYHWPTFNLADGFICIGVILMLVNIGLFSSKSAPTVAKE